MIILVVLLIAGLFYTLERKLYSRYWNHNLSVELRFSETCVDENDFVDLDEIVANRKMLPLPWVGLKLQVSRNLVFPNDEFTSVSDFSYREELFSLGMFQQIRRRHRLHCRKRGYYTIRSIDLVSADLLATCKLAAQTRSDVCLYVFPRPIPERELDIPFNRINGEQIVRRHLVEDPFIFRGIREYQMMDPLKSVNWKATAKTGDLMVNVAGYTSKQTVELLLNIEYPSLWNEETLLEDAIRVASTLADRLTAQGLGVGLRTNGRDVLSREEIHLTTGSSDEHLSAINESLARLDIHQKVSPFTEFLAGCLAEGEDGPLYLLISAAHSAEIQNQFRMLCAQNLQCLWILPTRSGVTPILEDDLLRSGNVFVREVLA